MKAILILLLLLSAAPAQAYLDPGTGSMILQVILGGVAAATVALKLYWQRIKSFFVRSPGDDGDSAAPESND